MTGADVVTGLVVLLCMPHPHSGRRPRPKYGPSKRSRPVADTRTKQPASGGGGGTKKGCPLTLLLMLPLLPLLIPVLLLLAAAGSPRSGHLGRRHKTTPPEASWGGDRSDPRDTPNDGPCCDAGQKGRQR